MNSTSFGTGNSGNQVGINNGSIYIIADRPETPPAPRSNTPFRRDPDSNERGTRPNQTHGQGSASGPPITAERPLLLLSLDGGGVRGLSSIMVLKRIMKAINAGRSPELEPWQVFDLIGGTGTGGIIALMIGRLQMSKEDCEDAYLQLSEKIFTRKRSRFDFVGQARDRMLADDRFDTIALETTIKECSSRKFASEDILLKNPDGPCKVFNVLHGISHIGLEEHKEVSAIADSTEDYLDHSETLKKLEVCIGRIRATLADREVISQATQQKRRFETPEIKYTGTPKFLRETEFAFCEPAQVGTLCVLRALSGIDILHTVTAQCDFGMIGEIPYVYIDSGGSDFGCGGDYEHEWDVLHEVAEKATRHLQLPAYCVPCSCMGTDPWEPEDSTYYRLCDIIRGAASLVVVFWTRKPGRPSTTVKEALAHWGARARSIHSLLLAPRGRPIHIYDASDGDKTVPTLSLSQRNLAAAVATSDSFAILRRLVDHYEGTITLGMIDLLVHLSRFLSTQRISHPFFPGDLSYILMGFLPFRTRPVSSDSSFQAFTRVLLVNDVGSFLERGICILPINQGSYTSFMVSMISPDYWRTNMRDIQPVCCVSGVGEMDTIIIENALGAAITCADPDVAYDGGSTSVSTMVSRLNDNNQLRFLCFRGDLRSSNTELAGLPGPLTVVLNGNSTMPPRPPSKRTFTLVDTYTMTAIPFEASFAPQVVLLCGLEGGMYRSLSCSYDPRTQTLYRETIVRLDISVAPFMSRMSRLRLKLESRCTVDPESMWDIA